MIERIRAELDTYRTPEHMINAQQFHKEKLKEPMVLKAGVVRSVSARYFKEIGVWDSRPAGVVEK